MTVTPALVSSAASDVATSQQKIIKWKTQKKPIGCVTHVLSDWQSSIYLVFTIIIINFGIRRVQKY